MIRRFSTVLLNCDRLSQKLIRSQTSLRLIPVRCIRTKHEGGGESKEQRTNESSNSADSSEKSQNEAFKQINIKMNEAQVKRLTYYFFGSFIVAAGLTYLALRQGFVEGVSLAGEEQIPFDVFVERFLKAGEVRRITYIASQGVAMAELHDGAIIDGKPYGKPGVIVKYERFVPNQPEQFQAEIRQIEHKLQINPRDSVPINSVKGISAFGAIEFVLGFSIIVFLVVAYARLGARRLAQDAIKDKGRPFQKNK